MIGNRYFDFCDVVVKVLVDIANIDHLVEIQVLLFRFLVELLLFFFADFGEVVAWLIEMESVQEKGCGGECSSAFEEE
jgi:hypothetical protein